MKIKVVEPVTTERFAEESRREIEAYVSDRTDFEVESLKYGTVSIESAYDEVLNVPEVVRRVERAESEGMDGVLIDCMGDPGLSPARESVEIPVVGPARTSMLYASDISYKFSVLTVTKGAEKMIENLATDIGVGGKLSSVKSIEKPVLELEERGPLLDTLEQHSLEAIERGAHSIVLGCTAMVGIDEDLSVRLEGRGYDVPVIYPTAVSIKHLENLISLNLTHSPITYRRPREKERNIWGLFD